MIELNKSHKLNAIESEMKTLRKQKQIQINTIAKKLKIGAPWASDMFSNITTLQTGKFINLIESMDMKLFLDPQTGDHVKPEELKMNDHDFVQMVIKQWHNHKIDGNQAMRKIVNKLNLKIGNNE